MSRFSIFIAVISLLLAACDGRTKVDIADSTPPKNLNEDIEEQAEEDKEPFNQNCNTTHINDPLFSSQWHLNSKTDLNLNAANLYQQNINGNDIKVAVVDNGIEINHSDLKSNILLNRSWSFTTDTNDPTPRSKNATNAHGTSVTGAIAAAANTLGGIGVAPCAQIMGFDWLNVQSTTTWVDVNGGERSKDALIINKSFGTIDIAPQPFDDFWNLSSEEHLQDVTSNNNEGRGVLFVKAAGNSFQQVILDSSFSSPYKIEGQRIAAIAQTSANQRFSATSTNIEPEAASFYHTLVAAVGPGSSTPHASYSTAGSSIWISAPGGDVDGEHPSIITTDLSGCSNGASRESKHSFNNNVDGSNPDCNYTNSFTGTSVAAPLISGVAALIWQANPELTWRDVRHILAKTAKKIDADFEPIKIGDFIAEPGWSTNKAGVHFHNWYGFGLADAQAAVSLAQDDYIPLSELQETDFLMATDINPLTIEDDITEPAARIFKIEKNLTIESVQIKLSLNHSRPADLAIELISPQGTRSILLQPNTLLIENALKSSVSPNFQNSILSSHAFYGESSQGQWTLKITDTNNGDFEFLAYKSLTSEPFVAYIGNNTENGTLTKAEIKFYGHYSSVTK